MISYGGWGGKKAYVLTVVFLGTRVGGYKGRGIREPLKNGAQPIAVRNNFQEGLDVTRI